MSTRAWQAAAGTVVLLAAASTGAAGQPSVPDPGRTPVAAPCDSDGVLARLDTALGATGIVEVTSVTLTGVAPACIGATASVVLAGDARHQVGAAVPTPVEGPVVRVRVRGAPAGQISSVTVVITG